jgi:hypothetical protein
MDAETESLPAFNPVLRGYAMAAEYRRLDVDPDIRTLVAALLCLAAASLLLHLAIALQFERLGVYFLNDVLFGSDTHDFLATLSHGEHPSRTVAAILGGAVHAYVWFYVAPFVRMVAWLAVGLHVLHGSLPDVRVELGVVAAPIFSALQTFALGIVLYLMGVRTVPIVLLSVLNIATFSGLIYGSVPDHFILSNLAITLLLMTVAGARRFLRADRLAVWIPLGLFTAGITITNVAVVGIAHFVTRLFARRLPFRTALARSFTLAVSIFVIIVVTIVAVDVMAGATEDTKHPDFVMRYLRPDETIAERFMRAERALGNAFAPAPGDVREKSQRTAVPHENYGVSRPALFDAPIFPNFTLEAPAGSNRLGSLLGLIALAGIGSGAVLMTARGGISRAMAVACLGIVGFNIVLHGLWGDEFVLYSQHWMAAAIVLIAGNLLRRERWRPWIGAGIAAYALAISVNNAAVLWSLIATLHGILLDHL